MLKRFWLLLLFVSTASHASSIHYSGHNELTVIGYHEIIDPAQALIPEYATSPDDFRKQMAWLQQHQFHFVSIDDILAARRGLKPLPTNAVLLTFDDGYRSVYDNAYPILKAYHAPAVVALVGSWLAIPEDQIVDFDHKKVPRQKFFSWEQLHEMVQSGLIELGNHTFDLHEGILANPQGNMEPAVTTHRYDADTLRYESESLYQKRIYTDLKKNNDLFHQHGFNKPRIMVWPYGNYNGTTAAIAVKLGMPLGLTLEDGPNTNGTPLTALRRILVESSTTPEALAEDIHSRDNDSTENDQPQKNLYVDLDKIYDKDPIQQEKNLSALLDRIQGSAINSVYVQAFSRSAQTGLADQLYFPNRHLPMRADLFNRVAWQIQSRTQVEHVFASMPLMAWDFSQCRFCSKHKHASKLKIIKDIYEDAAKTVNFDGLHFNDDVTLLNTKQIDKTTLHQFSAVGLPPSTLKVTRSMDMPSSISRQINALDQMTSQLEAVVRFWQPYLLTSHNVFQLPASMSPTQDLNQMVLTGSLKKFDFTIWSGAIRDPSILDDKNSLDLTPHTIRKLVFELNFDGSLVSNKPKVDAFQNQISRFSPNGLYHVIYDESPIAP